MTSGPPGLTPNVRVRFVGRTPAPTRLADTPPAYPAATPDPISPFPFTTITPGASRSGFARRVTPGPTPVSPPGVVPSGPVAYPIVRAAELSPGMPTPAAF